MDPENQLVNSGVLAQSPAQFAQLWALREGLTEAISKEGKAYKYDVSVPVTKFKEVVDTTKEHLRSKGLLGEDNVMHVIGYGHVGDGSVSLLYRSVIIQLTI
jgi:(R)-2-hydroxyglutarate---pyruvate transhydrogenase